MKTFIYVLFLLPMLLSGNQEYIQLSDRITDQFVKDYSQRTGVQLCGIGGGMVDDIDLICLTFEAYYRLDVPAARRIYIDGVKDLVHRYDTDRTVRFYLHNFPFDISNLEFKIMFQDRKPSGYVPRNYVAAMLNINNIILYAYFDSDLDRLVDFYKEPYEEALRIVQAERK